MRVRLAWRRSTIGLALAWTLGGGCASPAERSADVGREQGSDAGSEAETRPAGPRGDLRDAVLRQRFAAGERILSGFDPVEKDGAWRIGDRVLFGLSLEDGTDVFTRFVRLEMRSAVVAATANAEGVARLGAEGEERPFVLAPSLAPFEVTAPDRRRRIVPGPWFATSVSVFDETGLALDSELIALPEEALRRGFRSPAEAARGLMERTNQRRDRDRKVAAEDAIANAVAISDRMTELFGGALGFLEIFKSSPALESLRSRVVDEVVDTPGLLSVVFGGGVDGTVMIDVAGTKPMLHSLTAGSTWLQTAQIPMGLSLNERPALHCVVSAADPHPPFHLAAGVIGLHATHPTRPDRRVEIRLLAARRAAVGDP